jgi:hypothetical protein
MTRLVQEDKCFLNFFVIPNANEESLLNYKKDSSVILPSERQLFCHPARPQMIGD